DRRDVCGAGDGPAGVDAAVRLKPEVALVDIGLPGLNGYEVARRIRATEAGRAMKLIALTGYGQSADMRQAREAGFDLHLVKPVEPARLDGALREIHPIPEQRSASAPGAVRGRGAAGGYKRAGGGATTHGGQEWQARAAVPEGDAAVSHGADAGGFSAAQRLRIPRKDRGRARRPPLHVPAVRGARK